MFCYHCGKEIKDDDLFCPFCGQPTSSDFGDESIPEESPAESVEQDEEYEYEDYDQGSGKNKKLIIIAAAVLAALAIAAVLFFVLGNKSNDSGSTGTTEATSEAVQDSTGDVDGIHPGATEFEGHYYEVVDDAMTWTAAKAACEADGGHLVIITSQDEETFVEDLIEKDGSMYHYWLGATDEADEGVWKWVDGQTFWTGGKKEDGSGQAVGEMYENWLASQPNNSVKESPNGHDYLELQVTQGNEGDKEYMTWTDITNDGVAYGYEEAPDYNSTKYYGYVCEWDE